MLWVPGGVFTMGSDDEGEQDERPAHPVAVAGFWLDRTEVTNAAYSACVQAGVCREPLHQWGTQRADHSDVALRNPDQPVVGVSWDDADTYCRHMGRRLPTEAEFERAVRGDDGRRYPWGNEPPTAERTVFGRSLSTGATDPVGSHPTGRGPYGHDDLAGNVWEWLADEYDPIAYRRPESREGRPGSCDDILDALSDLRRRGLQGFTGSNPIPTQCERVIRGGAFNYGGPGLRSTNRVHHPGRYRLIMTGFRCAKSRGVSATPGRRSSSADAAR